MVKSMDLDMGDQEPSAREVKYVGGVAYQSDSSIVNAVNIDSFEPKYADRVCLRTVFEEEEMEEEEGLKENVEAEEVEKEVIEEKRVCMVDGSSIQNIEVYLKWEASKENPEKFITTLKVVKDASLADLRKLIAIYLGADNQAFIFLMLGDPTGASVPKEKEATIQKENQGAVVIFFTRTASQAASVAAARDFPARGGAAAPPCSLIGPPVTALVCSNRNQGQLVFCKQHGAAIKERSFKSLLGWLKRVVFLPLITMLSQKHSISRVPAHLTSQCLKNGPRRRLGARRPPRVAAHLTSRLKIWPRRRLGGRPEGFHGGSFISPVLMILDSHDNLRLQHCYQGILFQTACSFNHEREETVRLDLGFEKENLDILRPAYTSKKEHLPVAAKTKDRQKSPPPVCMARGPSCSRSRSRNEESIRGKDSDTSLTYRLVGEYWGIEVDVDKLENAFTCTSPGSRLFGFIGAGATLGQRLGSLFAIF
ncbi:unnamed protein product [Prunus armeniaca]